MRPLTLLLLVQRIQLVRVLWAWCLLRRRWMDTLRTDQLAPPVPEITGAACSFPGYVLLCVVPAVVAARGRSTVRRR